MVDSGGAGYRIHRTATHWLGTFTAMASPCQLLLDGANATSAEALTRLVQTETRRIENKFSRYRSDNIIHQVNTANGQSIEVDDETALLLDFAQTCHQLSNGLFDITSGVLRRVWRFDGSNRIPSTAEITKTLQSVGWNRIHWQRPWLTLQPGMEIDLGGIGKEYAVDRCAELLKQETIHPFLLNFGGDLRVSGVRQNGLPWRIGVEDPDMQQVASREIDLFQGAIATSGDSRRFLEKDGKRYSHILNPTTGWPVEDAPRSVTVAAPTTIEAGMLATFASLQGRAAETFLQQQQTQYWVLW